MRRCALAAAVLLLTVLAVASSAWAGTYQVSACDRAPGAVNDSWQPFNLDIAHMTTGQVCPPVGGEAQQSKATGLYATDDLNDTGNAASGASAGWEFLAPPATTIVAVQADRYLGTYGDSGWVPSLSAEGTALESCTFAYPEDECHLGGPFGDANTIGANVAVNDASTLTAEITCTASEGCLTGGTLYTAWAALYGATVTLQETSTPTIASVSGALWGPGLADGYHRGTESVSFTASDPTGISQAILSVEGHVISTQAGVCDYTYTIPCQPLSGTLELNTAQLADGPHTVTLAVYDAAGNEAQLTHPIVVANTAPPPPTGLSASRAPDGSDTVTWTDPAHVAPITLATYELCPSAGGACQPPQTVPDQQRLTGLSAPKGAWIVKVWLTDAIGNVNPAGAASVVLPAPLTLRVHHRLKGRRLTVYVDVPAEVRGPVSIGYQALRGTRVLEHGDRSTIVRHHEARISIRLTARAAAHATRLNLTARAPYALPARQLVSVARRPRR